MKRLDGMPIQHRSPEEIRELLSEYEGSGLTRQAFADRVGVCVWTIYNWLRKARELKVPKAEELLPAKRLVPVTIRSTASSPFELVTPRGLTLRIPVDFDPAALERLLALLERC
jgi:transposase-like protein